MRSAELAEAALRMKSVAFDVEDFWTTFEVIENGELGTAIPSDQPPRAAGLAGLSPLSRGLVRTCPGGSRFLLRKGRVISSEY